MKDEIWNQIQADYCRAQAKEYSKYSLSLLVLNEKYREILSYCPVLAHILTWCSTVYAAVKS
jgi:hypothetical protein